MTKKDFNKPEFRKLNCRHVYLKEDPKGPFFTETVRYAISDEPTDVQGLLFDNLPPDYIICHARKSVDGTQYLCIIESDK